MNQGTPEEHGDLYELGLLVAKAVMIFAGWGIVIGGIIFLLARDCA